MRQLKNNSFTKTPHKCEPLLMDPRALSHFDDPSRVVTLDVNFPRLIVDRELVIMIPV